MAGPVHQRRFRLRGEIGGVVRTFLLEPGENRVGSLPANDVVLPVPGVSRRHALLTAGSGDLAVRDLGSKNGVRIGDRRVEQARLRAGDRIRIGPVALKVEQVEADDARLAIVLPRSPAPPDPAPMETPLVVPDGGATPARASAGASGLTFAAGHLPCPSPAMGALYREMAAVAGSDLPALLRGETGVGKELLARSLHLSSRRAAGPFVAINCAAIPADLLEAEMFGIGEGVATGVEGREGRFRLADGGTLMLDEVGEMPRPLQAKLLRALETGEIQPLGRPPAPVDVRLVAATAADLGRGRDGGRLRRDLYYRLAGVELVVPPLRRRREDVAPLVEHFVRRAAAGSGKQVRGVTRGALERLTTYRWPGNVRELQHEVTRLVHRCLEGGVVDTSLLSPAITAGTPDGDETAAPASSLRLADHVEPLERRLIRTALERTGGNRTRAAELLGLSRNGLAYKMKSLGLDG